MTLPPVETRSAPARPRIALLLAGLDNDYEWVVQRGAGIAAEERGASLVCLSGCALEDPDPARSAQRFLFDLIAPSGVDAVLVIAGTVGKYVGPTRMGAWLRRFTVPVCSIGPAHGVNQVLVHDAAGTTELVEHLVGEHGYRRIAYIAGPAASAESQARLSAYEQALARAGIANDPRLVLPGDFTRPGGARAVHVLFDERQVAASDVDAIVAANDYMAAGAIEELVHRGVTVPDRIAVVGFDDVDAAATLSPPLTTVRQPMEQLGMEAVRMVLDLLENRSPEGVRRLPTELVLRRSCGCTPTEAPVSPKREAQGMAFGARRIATLWERSYGKQLADALLLEATGKYGALERVLEPFLQRLIHAGIDLMTVQAMLTTLRTDALSLVREVDSRERLEDAVHRARILVSRLVAEANHSRDAALWGHFHEVARAVAGRMFGPPTGLATALVEQLPKLGIDECSVSQLVPGDPQRLKLVFGFHRADVQPKSTQFAASGLAPAEFEAFHRGSVFALPLTYGDESLGVAVLPWSTEHRAFYDSLRELLGVVLKGALLARQVSRAP